MPRRTEALILAISRHISACHLICMLVPYMLVSQREGVESREGENYSTRLFLTQSPLPPSLDTQQMAMATYRHTYRLWKIMKKAIISPSVPSPTRTQRHTHTDLSPVMAVATLQETPPPPSPLHIPSSRRSSSTLSRGVAVSAATSAAAAAGAAVAVVTRAVRRTEGTALLATVTATGAAAAVPAAATRGAMKTRTNMPTRNQQAAAGNDRYRRRPPPSPPFRPAAAAVGAGTRAGEGEIPAVHHGERRP